MDNDGTCYRQTNKADMRRGNGVKVLGIEWEVIVENDDCKQEQEPRSDDDHQNTICHQSQLIQCL